jgi:hypothetical protein
MTLTRRACGAWPIVGAVIALAAMDPAALDQLPQPPVPSARPAATASIAGAVRSAAGDVPLARARIIASSPSLAQPRVTLSGADGRYAIAALPAGTYTLTAVRTGYATQTFGERRGTASAGVTVTDGQAVAGIDFALIRGGAIAGRILDEDGTPLAGAVVEALVSRSDSGRRTLSPAASARTDDRGEFRVFGLPPGQYYVSASDPAFSDVSTESGAVKYTPTFFPGVSAVDEARAVAVRDSGEAQRVEFRLKLVPPARISGRIVASDGRPLLSGAVTLAPVQRDGVQVVPPEDVWIGPDGTFSFGHVPPGRYRISARGETVVNGPALFATYGLIVEGRAVDNVQMTLRPGATLDGELTLDSEHAARAPVLSTLRVRAPFADGGGFADALTGAVQADGKFVLRGLMTGDHQIVVEGLRPPWVVKSVLFRGRDVADAGIEALEGQHLRGARITITDRASEVSGRVREGGGPVADAAVLVYPVAPQFWVRMHRRMRMTRTDAEGRFSVRGLPEGEYLAIASGAIDEGDLGRRELLDAIRTLATPVSISGPDARVTIELPFLAVLPGAPVQTR